MRRLFLLSLPALSFAAVLLSVATASASTFRAGTLQSPSGSSLLNASAVTVKGSRAGSIASLCRRASSCARTLSAASRNRVSSVTGSRRSSMRPEAILDKSSSSLMSWSRWRPLREMVSR